MPTKAAPSQESLASVLAELKKKDTKIGTLSDFHLVPEDPFSTGNIVLDYITGVWGFPRGRILELYGLNQSGKTTSALQAAALHQKRVKAGESTGLIIFLDYERSLDEKYCRALGLDVDDSETFLMMQPDSFEDGVNAYRKLLRTGEVALAIVDSVAAMVPEAELWGDTGKAEFASRAKLMHQFMRQVTGPLHQHQSTLIMLNHVMEVIDTSPMGQRMASQGIKRQTTPGGRALGYYTSMRIEFKQIKSIKTAVADVVTGEAQKFVTSTDIEAKVTKNKVAVPWRSAPLRVRFGLGFSQAYSAFRVLVNNNVVKSKGSGRFLIPDELLPADKIVPVGEENILSAIEKDEEWLSRLVDRTREVLSELPDPIGQPEEEIDPETGEVL
jgi:recombination protein RecA